MHIKNIFFTSQSSSWPDLVSPYSKLWFIMFSEMLWSTRWAWAWGSHCITGDAAEGRTCQGEESSLEAGPETSHTHLICIAQQVRVSNPSYDTILDHCVGERNFFFWNYSIDFHLLMILFNYSWATKSMTIGLLLRNGIKSRHQTRGQHCLVWTVHMLESTVGSLRKSESWLKNATAWPQLTQ